MKLPLDAISDDTEVSITDENESENSTSAPLRILWLEDVYRDADLAMRELRRSGIICDVRVIFTREEMLRELESFIPDIILSDFSMPQFTGMDALEIRNEQASNLPFIIVTAAMNEETAVDCIKRGADDYVTKDHLRALPHAVRGALEKKRLECAERQARQQVRFAAHQWRTTFDAMQDGVALLDPDLNILRCNPALCFFIGKSFDEIIDQKWNEVISGVADALNEYPSKRVIRTLKRETWKSSIGDRWFDFFADPILDAEGRLSGIVHVVKDITEQKQAEEALKSSEDRYRSTIDNMMEGCQIIGFDWRYLYINNAVVAHGRHQTKANLLGHTMMEVDPGIEKTELFGFLRRCMDDRVPHHMESKLTFPDGSNTWLELSIQPVPEGIFILSIDISERKEAEAERAKLEKQLRRSQKLETIGTLAGGIAHDFNNILTPIVGYTELATTNMSPTDPLFGQLQQILTAAMRAKDLVDQILIFSRQLEKDRKPLNLHLIVKEALKLLRPAIPTTIEIVQKIDTSCNKVLADAAQIHQVIVNLCTNAYQAMQEKGGTLTIEVKQVDVDALSAKVHPNLHEGEYIRLTVKDTGIGMDATTIDRIFEPFFTTKSVGKGTGMGLSVVHGIVRSHQGDIMVYSEPGKGASFHVYIPTTKDESAPEPKAKPPIQGGCESVLVIDDEKLVLNVVELMLDHLGYQVTSYNSCPEALTVLIQQPHKFDLVISDLTMPKMTGLDLAKELQLINPKMPVIIMSGHGENITKNIQDKYGIQQILRKPIDLRELATTIRKILDH